MREEAHAQFLQQPAQLLHARVHSALALGHQAPVALLWWAQLAHYARYLKAITLRLDKYRADPARDATKLAELRPQEQRYWRLVAERKGAVDARMQELRWLLEELRVSFFAQELRTPQPVSVKRLDKLWAQIQS